MTKSALTIASLLLSSALYAQTLPIVVSTPATCATSTDGSVVSLANPTTATINTTSGSGSLAAGTYYTMYEWYDASGNVTLASPETVTTTSATGSLVVNPPSSGVPSGATGMDVFIGASSGGETLQGQTTGSASFVQSSDLTSGTALATANTTICKVVANDAGWPAGTGYRVSMTDANGNAVPGWPLMLQINGAGSTYNLSQGLPYYHGVVTYPVPLLSQPQNHGAQSITGPIIHQGWNVLNIGKLGVGTSTPGWPIDVENGSVNASGGFLVNGSGGAAGTCLGSDGTAFDTVVDCLTTANFFYQHIALNGTTQTQRSTLNFNSTVLTTTDSSTSTTINLPTTGSDSKVVTAAAAGTSGHCVTWTSSGGLGDSGGNCVNSTGVSRTCNTYGCYRVDSDGTATEWVLVPYASMNQTVTLPYPLASTCESVQATTFSSTDRITYVISCTPGSPSTIKINNNGSGAQAYVTVVGW
jgi:hypothetical protein